MCHLLLSKTKALYWAMLSSLFAFVIISGYLFKIYAQPIASTINEIEIITHSFNGGDGSPLTLTLKWHSNQYVCQINPSATNTPYSCDSNDWTEVPITADEYIPYHIKLEWNSSAPIQIASISVTDGSSNFYTVDRFCIR